MSLEDVSDSFVFGQPSLITLNLSISSFLSMHGDVFFFFLICFLWRALDVVLQLQFIIYKLTIGLMGKLWGSPFGFNWLVQNARNRARLSENVKTHSSPLRGRGGHFDRIAINREPRKVNPSWCVGVKERACEVSTVKPLRSSNEKWLNVWRSV